MITLLYISNKRTSNDEPAWIKTKLNDSPVARWTVLFLVAYAMMMGYYVTYQMSPLEHLLESPVAEGGLGWSSTDYGFVSSAYGFINVFLFMLFIGGVILDKMGVRFTGILACSLMVLGVSILYYAIEYVPPTRLTVVDCPFWAFITMPTRPKCYCLHWVSPSSVLATRCAASPHLRPW
ncbi:hypothetical protein [Hoylesella marshii]|uniref:hypothetical protein n=1 Tax=Hoylesella marshii TaxID=189722 RepID=UPI0035AB7F2D